jgi:hypothetical protein
MTGVGRKILSKALKLLISRKEMRFKTIDLSPFLPAFSTQKAHFSGKTRSYPLANARRALELIVPT